jgi:hypothetical protein
MSFICDYCDAKFTRNYNLKQHQLNTKYCKKLQRYHQKQLKKVVCNYCGIDISTKGNLKRHQETCSKFQQNNKVEKLEQEITFIKSLLSQIVQNKPDKEPNDNVVNNRNVVLGNLQPVVEQDIQAIALEYLTIDDIKKGVNGLVTFVLNYPLGKNLICTDKSRRKLQYKDANGNIVNDVGGVKLSQTFFKAINTHSQNLISTEYNNINIKVQDIVGRGMASEENVSELMMQAMAIQTLGAKCNEIADGEDNDVRIDFVKQLTKQL